jgi:hypothetical protein
MILSGWLAGLQPQLLFFSGVPRLAARLSRRVGGVPCALGLLLPE